MNTSISEYLILIKNKISTDRQDHTVVLYQTEDKLFLNINKAAAENLYIPGKNNILINSY